MATDAVASTPAAAATATEAAPAPMQVDARVDTVEARAAELVAKIEADQTAAAAASLPDVADEKPAKAAPAKTGKAAAAAKDPDTERQERVARAAALEREAVKAKKCASDLYARLESERATIDARAKELSAREAEVGRMAKLLSGDDPLSLLELVADKVPADKLADFFIQSKDPAKRAEWAAKRAAQEAASKADPRTEALQQRIEAMEARAAHAEAQAARADAENSFRAKAKEMADAAPHVSSLLAKRPQQVMANAHAVADHLAQTDAEWSDSDPSTRFAKIVEFMEADLSGFAELFSPQSKGSDEKTSTSHVSGAAAVSKARTLTSRTSAGRSKLVDEDELSKLPIDKRAEKLKEIATRLAAQDE